MAGSNDFLWTGARSSTAGHHGGGGDRSQRSAAARQRLTMGDGRQSVQCAVAALRDVLDGSQMMATSQRPCIDWLQASQGMALEVALHLFLTAVPQCSFWRRDCRQTGKAIDLFLRSSIRKRGGSGSGHGRSVVTASQSAQDEQWRRSSLSLVDRSARACMVCVRTCKCIARGSSVGVISAYGRRIRMTSAEAAGRTRG